MDNKKLVDDIISHFKGISINDLDNYLSSILCDLYKVKELIQSIRTDTETKTARANSNVPL